MALVEKLDKIRSPKLEGQQQVFISISIYEGNKQR